MCMHVSLSLSFNIYIYIYIYICVFLFPCSPHGLRILAEPMYTHLVGILMLSIRPTLTADDFIDVMNVPEGVAMRDNLKRAFRSIRDRRAKDNSTPYIETYPNTPEELKEAYPHVFAEAYPHYTEDDPSTGPVPSQIKCMVLDDIRKTQPCRKTHTLAVMAGSSGAIRGRPPTTGYRSGDGLLQMMAGLAQQAAMKVADDGLSSGTDLLRNLKVFAPGEKRSATRESAVDLTTLMNVASPQQSQEATVPLGDAPPAVVPPGDAHMLAPHTSTSLPKHQVDVNAMAQDILSTMGCAKKARQD